MASDYDAQKVALDLATRASVTSPYEVMADTAQALRAAYEAGERSRDVDLRALIAEAYGSSNVLREQAVTDRGLGCPAAAEYKMGKADIFGWVAGRLKGLLGE